MTPIDPVLLARIQFALTIGFHFIFAPLTIGMAWVIVIMMTRFLRTGSKFYKDMSRFWIKVFALSFVVGVATGLTMEFQFGTNWSQYSRMVGDIFGAPLAAEAVIAFFMESTFLALLVFGWKKASPRLLWFASLMVALGSTLSAFWILVANSWQQTPAGFKLEDGRAVLTDFGAAIFNPSMLPRFLHTMDAAIMTGAFFIMGLSAIFILKRKHLDFAKTSFGIAFALAVVATFAQLPLGHYHAVQVAHTQPVKLAAFEGLFKTQSNAPMCIIGVPCPEVEEVTPAIYIQGLLSFMIYGTTSAEVKGLDAFPKEEWPPVALTFYSFHFMVGIGMFLIAICAFGVYLFIRGKLFESRFFMWLAILCIPLPFIANELGWITAEVGRQPWAVYGILKTKDAVSISVPASHILLSMITLIIIYALLFTAWLFILRREMAHGPAAKEAQQI